MDEARKVAESEGVALNQLINVAIAEKVSTLRTEEYFRERARRADRAQTLRILARAGKGNPPMAGDELPPDSKKQDWKREARLKKPPQRSASRVGLLRKRRKKKSGR
jgi:hypothetical protein